MTLRYFEDFAEGEVAEGGRREMTEADIVTFATDFDPQPFHTDEAAEIGRASCRERV